MDWPNVEDPFLGKEEGFFDYVEEEPKFEPDPELASRALSSHGKEKMSILPLHWMNMEKNWDEWRSSLVLSRDLTKIPLGDQETGSGYHILLSARVLPILPGVESLNSLPFAEKDWQLVTSQFYLHNAVCEPMLDTLLSSYTTYLVKDHKNETLDMYTAVMSSDYEDFLAVSSTYFRKSRVTAAVVYGCNKKQMDHVQRLLDNSPEVKSHPLLMVGVFEELQRKRLNKLHGDAGTEFVDIITDLDSSNSKKAELEWKQQHNTSIRNCRTRIRKLQEETRVAQCQLEKMMEQVTELKSQPAGQQPKVAWPGIELMANTNRYMRRFKDICLEYEGMVAIYQLWSDELTFTYDLFMQDAALNEAKQSRHQAKAATVLAFVAMVYLPSSTVATIFAMPIFNWQARWWDIHAIFEAQSSADSASPSTNQTSGDPGPEAVLSGYFWIYFSVSLFMTFLTVVICFFYISDWTPVINFSSSIWSTMKTTYWIIKIRIGMGSKSKSTDDAKPISRKGTFKPPDGTSLMEIRSTVTAEPPTSTDAASTTNPTNHGRASFSATASSRTADLPPPPPPPNPSQPPPKQPPTPAPTLRSIIEAVAATTSPVTSNLATTAAASESTRSHTITSPTPATVPVSISPASPKGNTASEPQGGSSSTVANSGSTAVRSN